MSNEAKKKMETDGFPSTRQN